MLLPSKSWTVSASTQGVRMENLPIRFIIPSSTWSAACAIYTDCVLQTEADSRVKGLHCGSLCPVRMQGGCKRYPCLLPCPTLTLLHPGQAAKEWGSPGNRTAGEAREGRGVAESGGWGSMEARLSASWKRGEPNTSKISFNILYPSLE